MIKKQIFYHDTDAGGVVYYGRYCNFLEEARTKFLENKGLSVRDLAEQGFLYAVRTCHLQYKKPARYGDIIHCDAQLVKLTAAQIIFKQYVTLAENQDVLLEADVQLVSLNTNFKPKAIPEKIKQQIAS